MTKKNIHILYVEDDESLAFLTKDNLEQYGFTVNHAESGSKAYEIYKTNSFDVCIVDIMLPDMDGFTLVEKIRKTNEQIPVLFLSAKALPEDRIKGLSIGADDYITKPFSIKELILRIEVFLKRSGVEKQNSSAIYSYKDFSYDHANLVLIVERVEHSLTFKEGALLNYMLKNSDTILKRDDILKDIWGDDDYFLGRSLDVFISRLRKFLKPQQTVSIENIHGVGFRMRIEK